MNLPKPRKINADRYVGGLSRSIQWGHLDDAIKMSANESALGPSPKAIQAFEKNKNNLFRYPDDDSQDLKDTIAHTFNKIYELKGIDPRRIICGSGSDQIFDLICKVFLSRGDEVIVTQFGFIMHRIYASLHKATIRFAKEKNFKASVDEILKKVSKKTKIVFIANPNNPTGTYLSKNEMLDLRKKLRSNILLVIDDAYAEFMTKDDFSSGLELFKNVSNVLITRTFSKIYGLAGLRLGWGFSSKQIIDAMYKVKPPFNVNSAALAAGEAAIWDIKWTDKAIKHNTLWSKKIFFVLKKYNIKTNEPTANFFLMNFDEAKVNSKDAFNKLGKKGLVLREMKQYKIPNSLRFTIGKDKENEFFIKSIREICQ